MTVKQNLCVAASLLAFGLLLGRRAASAQVADERVVRIAEIEIVPAQAEAYKAALREEIEASIRLEPGVLSLEAVSVKDDPEQVRLFETYKNGQAYRAHLLTAHFLKYKATTVGMVKSLRLVETDVIVLGAKGRSA